jgi:hypothetical protein
MAGSSRGFNNVERTGLSSKTGRHTDWFHGFFVFPGRRAGPSLQSKWEKVATATSIDGSERVVSSRDAIIAAVHFGREWHKAPSHDVANRVAIEPSSTLLDEY